MKKENGWWYLVPVFLLLASFGGGRWVFSRAQETALVETPKEEEVVEEDDDSLIKLDESMARTEVCPLNGEKYTLPEKEAWSKRRPLAVMIENSTEARPQSGLASADIVFELVAEGGITRFMAMYYCDAQRNDVLLAPVRSARTYFIDLASGFNRPMYVHVGGANVDGPADALGQLASYGWNTQNDINQFSVGYPTFIRDYNRIAGKEVATEHTMTTTTEKLWAVAEKRGWTNMSPDLIVNRKTVAGADWQEGYKGWSFNDGTSKAASQNVSYDFWSGQPAWSVSWTYEAATNTYLRANGGEKQVDLNSGRSLTFTNVVVIFAKETGPFNEEKHMLYGVIGKGTGYLFAGGVAEEISWEKTTRESELVLLDKKGSNLVMPRGKVWVSVLPVGNKVTY
jgi:hypothetical protein